MEDDILIIGCDSDDEIDSTCSDTSSDQLKSTSPSEEAGGESDARPRKRKREESQERRLTLGEELALTDSENEGSEDQNETFKDKKRRKVEEIQNTEEAKAADIGNAIYSLGNYCPRMLRGVPCTKARCSWVHYMVPSSAVSQLYRILANRYASISLSQQTDHT